MNYVGKFTIGKRMRGNVLHTTSAVSFRKLNSCSMIRRNSKVIRFYFNPRLNSVQRSGFQIENEMKKPTRSDECLINSLMVHCHVQSVPFPPGLQRKGLQRSLWFLVFDRVIAVKPWCAGRVRWGKVSRVTASCRSHDGSVGTGNWTSQTDRHANPRNVTLSVQDTRSDLFFHCWCIVYT